MNGHITDTEWLALTADRTLPRGTWVYREVTSTQLSIARHDGRTQVNDRWFTYVPATDELIRDDVLAALRRLRGGVPAATWPAERVAALQDGEGE